jgi:hypothetical protein
MLRKSRTSGDSEREGFLEAVSENPNEYGVLGATLTTPTI